MKSYMEILFILLGSCLLISALDSLETEGSGTVDDDDDIYIQFSSGVESSGGGAGDTLPTDNQNMKCSDLYCWCVDDSGKEVPNTRVYGTAAENCAQYASTTEKSTIKKGLLGAAPKLVTEVTETEPTEDFVFVDTTTKAATAVVTEKLETTSEKLEMVTKKHTPTKKQPPPPVVLVKSTHKPGYFDNEIKVRSTARVKVIDEEREEETNNIGGENGLYSAVVRKEDLPAGNIIFAHPGILAAIIGGAVVGLLCAILLIMFIVYRMRKKDEGSYPLNDTKPMNYQYAKAPSREFYA
ncbi:Sdc [Bugula neritina]|uniref:Syndecan n=1 Tax=Bugula neritina TaxID=10212 RepID=A0A7J7J311_BUGNE|nr:Sdc [Bugula neritina]